MSAAAANVRLTDRASRLVNKGRMWLFADDLEPHDCAHGTLARVTDRRGRDLGLGWFSATSRLALRLCGAWPEPAQPPTAEQFFESRLFAAVRRRGARARDPEAAVRCVHGEADWLPGLVVDRYADCAVVQITAAALEEHLDAIVPAVCGELAPRTVLARDDLGVRRLEGLPGGVRLLHGRRVEMVEIVEHGLRVAVDLLAGHKTGLYLDQAPARHAVREAAAGRARVLDLFCYQGGFALNALAGGAAHALAVDQSDAALARARSDAERNRLDGLETARANAFDLLRDLRGRAESFDLIVVDPPAFAKSRRELEGGLRGYRDLNRQALRLLAPGGMLLTCTCSHHVTAARFEEVLRQAAVGLPFRVVVRERSMAGVDHPVLLRLPESEYLKVVLLERID